MSEVITKRLMTDDTGQEIVSALEDLATAVKPTAAEMDMSSTDTTKVKDAIETNSQAITNLEKCNLETAGKTAFTGDVFSADAGVHRCSRLATNVPANSNGFLIVINRDANTKAIEYITDGGVHYINSKNETYGWTGWQQLAKTNATDTVTFTGNSSFNEYFTLGASKSVVGNGLYCLTLTVTTKKAVPVGEMSIGTVSVVPYWQIPCTMIMTSNSSLVGGGLISSSGGSTYISPSESIATGRTIIINFVGTYY